MAEVDSRGGSKRWLDSISSELWVEELWEQFVMDRLRLHNCFIDARRIAKFASFDFQFVALVERRRRHAAPDERFVCMWRTMLMCCIQFSHPSRVVSSYQKKNS